MGTMISFVHIQMEQPLRPYTRLRTHTYVYKPVWPQLSDTKKPERGSFFTKLLLKNRHARHFKLSHKDPAHTSVCSRLCISQFTIKENAVSESECANSLPAINTRALLLVRYTSIATPNTFLCTSTCCSAPNIGLRSCTWETICCIVSDLNTGNVHLRCEISY